MTNQAAKLVLRLRPDPAERIYGRAERPDSAPLVAHKDMERHRDEVLV